MYYFVSNSAMGQQADTNSNSKSFSIKINPIQIGMGEVRLLGEKYFNQHHSIELIASYFPSYRSYELYMEHQYGFKSRKGFKMGLSYRYYWNSKWYINPLFFYKYIIYDDAEAPEGSFKYNRPYFYLPPDIVGSSGKNEIYDYFIKVYASLFQMGHKMVSKHITLDFYWGAGLRYKHKQKTDTSDRQVYNYILASGHLGINIGYIR